MNRNEAIAILKEVFEKCKLLDGTYVSLMPPNSADLESQGYQIHIKTPIDEMAKMCMEKILNNNRLSLKTENDLAIIYRPK